MAFKKLSRSLWRRSMSTRYAYGKSLRLYSKSARHEFINGCATDKDTVCPLWDERFDGRSPRMCCVARDSTCAADAHSRFALDRLSELSPNLRSGLTNKGHNGSGDLGSCLGWRSMSFFQHGSSDQRTAALLNLHTHACLTHPQLRTRFSHCLHVASLSGASQVCLDGSSATSCTLLHRRVA